MVKSRKYVGLALIVVYAFFFASANLFYHTHQLANSKLVHSHPFSGAGHSHTANQVVLIDLLDSATYQESSEISVPDAVSLLCCREIPASPEQSVLSVSAFSFSLRAPPATC